jgi:hypothetical protein
MENSIKWYNSPILTDGLPTPAPAQYTSISMSAPIGSTLGYRSNGLASQSVPFKTMAPVHTSSTIGGKATPEQGAVIALGIICGLLMLGVLLFMILYFSRSRRKLENTTTNIRILPSPRRPHRSNLLMARSKGRGGPRGTFEALEFPGHHLGDIAGLRGVDQSAMRGRYAAEMHSNGLFGGMDGQNRQSYFQQDDGQANAFETPIMDYDSQNVTQPPPLQLRRPIRGESPVNEPLGGGLGRNSQPIRGGPSLGSRHSSRLSGRDNFARRGSWL